ncbi:hypothetical protein L195_g000362 [Trifolium pratense]|uniref:Uncharacterized protein n=1 Tax=Trifolium pratense TaxID=57577 RepID=A0A2K3NLM7_TRIPR|nr:hypothetical protein L195_g000362 [Trifolium pratense]
MVTETLCDNNPSHEFPLTDKKDLDLNSETLITPPGYASKLVRFAVPTIV